LTVRRRLRDAIVEHQRQTDELIALRIDVGRRVELNK
jgi:hypothetical protein